MPPRKKKAAAEGQGEGTGLLAAETGGDGREVPAEVQALGRRVAQDGGRVLSTYREPLGGAWVLLSALPIDKVEPTPYQRELSETHADRLAAVMTKVGRFLDPLIAVAHDGGYWTPNGMHRLAAMRRLGARAVVALVLTEPEIAFRILALNTEKAHNLKDKSLEVVRMARALAGDATTAGQPESRWAFEFEEPAYLTVGLCYEKNGRFAGGAYLPVVKRCEEFMGEPISESLELRARRAARLLELDEAVAEVVQRLKAAGLQSAYLKPFVIARINPLRFQKPARPGQKAPRADLEETLDRMLASASRFDVGKVKPQDLASAATFAQAGADE
jgi:ParB family transcriptional regulator, chromosome partitioning protein